MSDPKVIERIKKLLELASSANENDSERQLAMDRAQELMLKHSISESDLEHDKIPPIIVQDYHNDIIYTKQGVKPVFGAILAAIAPIFGCYGLVKIDPVSKSPTGFQIIGFPTNIEIVKYALDSLLTQGLLAARAEFRKVRSITFGFGFWTGYAAGLSLKFETSAKKSEGIEIYDKVKQVLEQLATGEHKIQGDYGLGYQHGHEAGQNAEIRKPIATENQGNLLK